MRTIKLLILGMAVALAATFFLVLAQGTPKAEQGSKMSCEKCSCCEKSAKSEKSMESCCMKHEKK